MDAVANFTLTTVAIPLSPATSGTSLTVHSGDGANFPATPFSATVWPPGVSPTWANAEIVRVTVVTGDILTITRAQESTTAQPIAAGYQIAQALTAGLWTQSLTSLPLAGGTMTGPIVGFQDKGGQVLNALAYGAVGNFTANDTVAIQAAIDAASAAGGGKVLLPAGYVFGVSPATTVATMTYALYHASNVTIQCEGTLKLLAATRTPT